MISIKHYMLRLVKRKRIIRILRKLFPVNPNNRFINICSGEWYYPGWENVDFICDDFFIDHKIDLNKKSTLPFDDETVQIIFFSHGLYYFDEKASMSVLKECYRVLKAGGLLRLIVVDFENDNIPTGFLLSKEESLRLHPDCCQVLSHYTYSEMYEILDDIGFMDIQKMSCEESSVPLLTKTVFECNQGNRNEWSVYVEAKK